MAIKPRGAGVMALTAVLVLGVVLPAGANARIDGSFDRTAATSTPSHTTKSGADAQRSSRATAPRRAGCKLRCVKRKLAKLTKRFNALHTSYYNCEQLVDVTSYFGYEYGDGEGGTVETSALDFTDEGDFADEQVVVWVC